MIPPKFSIQNQSVLYIAPVNGQTEYRGITGDRIYIGDFVCGEWYDTGNEVMAPRIVAALNQHDALVKALTETSQVLGWAFNKGADPEPVATALQHAREALAAA